VFPGKKDQAFNEKTSNGIELFFATVREKILNKGLWFIPLPSTLETAL